MHKAALYLRASDIFTRFRLTLIVSAMFITALGVVKSVHASSNTPQQIILQPTAVQVEIQAIKDRIQKIEDTKTEERLARLETYQESNRWLLTTIAGGVILMCLEAGVRVVKGRRRD